MKSTDDLISSIRYRVGESSVSYDTATGITSAGLRTSVFLEMLNDAQDMLQSRLINVWPSLFLDTAQIPLVAGQEAYNLNDRIAYGTKVTNVQYSVSGSGNDYSNLSLTTRFSRRGSSGLPSAYYRAGNVLHLVPIPESATGVLRATFYKRLDDLDVRRGKVSGTPALSVITLDASFANDDYAIANSSYVCVSDGDGNVLLRNGKVASYDPVTHLLTLTAAVDTYLEAGFLLADLDTAYVTVGRNTTTHSKLPEECERFLRVYTQKRILTVRESNTSEEEDTELSRILDDIISSFADEEGDIESFYIIDPELMW